MIEVVPNEPRFYEFIRALRTDERVQHGFIEQVEITLAEQLEYMETHADEYLVALVDGVPAGYAGSVDGDIRVCTHPAFQGKGVGQELIKEVLRRWPESVAKVKVDNQPSLRLFESCGFRPVFVILAPPAEDGEGDG